MKQAFGYIRVSTQGQADEGISLEAQEAKIAAWCLANDVELGGCFIDAGISGKRADNRPELQRALDAVTAASGVLVVYSLSRLARSTKDTLLIGERLEKHGADLVSLSEKIDTTSAAGKMVFRMLAVLAEFERDLVSERTKSAMSHLKSQGKRVGQIPFGFDLADDSETLVENADEQEVIALLVDLRKSGLSYGKIAAELNSRGIQTKDGKQWRAMTASRILKRVV
jgi:site-specific DNA recombinase